MLTSTLSDGPQLRRRLINPLEQLHHRRAPLRRRLRLQCQRKLRTARQRDRQLRGRQHRLSIPAPDPHVGHELRQPYASHRNRMRVLRTTEAGSILWRLQLAFRVQRHGRPCVLRAV